MDVCRFKSHHHQPLLRLDIDLNLLSKQCKINSSKKYFADGDQRKDQIEEFLQEGLMMKDYNHPNVLPLIGVALKGNSPMIVLPFMEHGDLKKYIKIPNHVSVIPVFG